MPQGGVCPREDLEGTVTTAAAQTCLGEHPPPAALGGVVCKVPPSPSPSGRLCPPLRLTLIFNLRPAFQHHPGHPYRCQHPPRETSIPGNSPLGSCISLLWLCNKSPLTSPTKGNGNWLQERDVVTKTVDAQHRNRAHYHGFILEIKGQLPNTLLR